VLSLRVSDVTSITSSQVGNEDGAFLLAVRDRDGYEHEATTVMPATYEALADFWLVSDDCLWLFPFRDPAVPT
jgi:hypothetical protein